MSTKKAFHLELRCLRAELGVGAVQESVTTDGFTLGVRLLEKAKDLLLTGVGRPDGRRAFPCTDLGTLSDGIR